MNMMKKSKKQLRTNLIHKQSFPNMGLRKPISIDGKKLLATIKLVLKIVSQGVVCAMTGFGFFFCYYLSNQGIWFSMLVGMFVSSMVMILLRLPTTRGKK